MSTNNVDNHMYYMNEYMYKIKNTVSGTKPKYIWQSRLHMEL